MITISLSDIEGGGGGRHRRKNMTATIGLVVHAAGESSWPEWPQMCPISGQGLVRVWY